MDYSNLQLRSKTFLDFTNDKKIIKKVIGDHDAAFFLSHLSDENRALTYLYFSDFTPDKQLSAAILREFENESSLLFNE